MNTKRGGKGEKDKKGEKQVKNGELFVQVVCGENLLAMDECGTSDPFVVLKHFSFLDKGKEEKMVKRFGTSVVHKTLDPVWNEGTTFLIPAGKEKETRIHAVVYDEDQIGRDYMGEFQFNLGELLSDDSVDFANYWIPLDFKKERDRNAGRILCQLNYITAEQLEGPSHIVQRHSDVLIELFFWDDQWFSLLYALGTSFLSDKIAAGIVQCSLEFGVMESLMYSLLKREISQTMQESTLFRTDSIATKVLRSFLRQTTLPFARSVLAETVEKVISDPDPYDLKIEVAQSEGSIDQEEVRNRLFELILQLLSTISDQIRNIPPVVLQSLSMLRSLVGKSFPKSARISIGGFFFLRFLCPAVVTPEIIDLVKKPPSKKARTVLTLLSKTIQNMSNQTLMKSTSNEMKNLNEFISKNTPKVQGILDQLSLEEGPMESGSTNPFAVLCSVDRSLSKEQLESVENPLLLFIHHLRENSLDVRAQLQKDILKTKGIISKGDWEKSCTALDLLCKDIGTEEANQIASFPRKHTTSQEYGLPQGEEAVFESSVGIMVKENGGLAVKVIVTNRPSLLLVLKFFDFTKIVRYPVFALVSHREDGSKPFFQLESKSPSKIMFANPADHEALEKAIQKSEEEEPPSLSSLSSSSFASFASSSSSSSSVLVAVTKDKALRPYDWDGLLNLVTTNYYPPSEVVCRKGAHLGGLFQVSEGTLIIPKEIGSKKVLGTFQSHDVFGLTSFIDSTPATSDLVAGESGVIITGLETKKILPLFRKDAVLSSKFYTFVAQFLSRHLTMLTSQAVSSNKTEGLKDELIKVERKGEKGEGKGEKEEKEEKKFPLVVPACLCRMRDAYGNFTVDVNSAVFVSKVFGLKVEVVLDYGAIRAGVAQIAVVNVKGKARLQIKSDETHVFKMDDPKGFVELVESQSEKGPPSKAEPITKKSKTKTYTVPSVGDALHETMSPQNWDHLLSEGSTTKRFRKDEICLKEGESQKDLYQIITGSVRISKGGKLIAKLGAGSILGEVSFLNWFCDGTEAFASAHVVADDKKVEMVVLEGKYLSRALGKNPRMRSCFFVYISQLLVERVRRTLEITYSDS